MGLQKLSPTGLQSQMLWGLIFLVQDPWAGEPDMRLRTLTPMGEPLYYNYSPLCGLPRGMGLDYIMSPPLLPNLFWFLLYCL